MLIREARQEENFIFYPRTSASSHPLKGSSQSAKSDGGAQEENLLPMRGNPLVHTRPLPSEWRALFTNLQSNCWPLLVVFGDHNHKSEFRWRTNGEQESDNHRFEWWRAQLARIWVIAAYLLAGHNRLLKPMNTSADLVRFNGCSRVVGPEQYHRWTRWLRRQRLPLAEGTSRGTMCDREIDGFLANDLAPIAWVAHMLLLRSSPGCCRRRVL